MRRPATVASRSALRDRLPAGPPLLWSAIFAGLLGYSLALQRTYIDDAYITLQYARNLAEHLTWGSFPDRTTNTATSPLNVILLALAVRLPGSAIQAVALLNAVELTLLLAVLLRISRRLLGGPHFGIFAFVALATNPLLVSGIGLEGYLYALLMLAAIDRFLAERWGPVAVALALLTLTRPEGVLLFAILAALMPVPRRTLGRVVLTYGLVVLPWYLFSWVHLGSVVPDTLLIKTGQQPWEGTTTFGNGPALYLRRFREEILASTWLLPVAVPALLPLRRAAGLTRRAMAALVLYGATHYGLYTALAVPPFHWYYTHQIVPLVVLGSLGAAVLLRRLSRSDLALARSSSYALALAPALVLAALLATDRISLREAPIHSNWAAPTQYEAIGLWLREHIEPTAIIELRGEVGMLSYYSERYLVDDFTDRNRITAALELREDDRSPVAARLLAANFAWRHTDPSLPPPSYALEFGAAVDASGNAVPPNPDALVSWEISSRWMPAARVSLRRVGDAAWHVSVTDNPPVDGRPPGAISPPRPSATRDRAASVGPADRARRRGSSRRPARGRSPRCRPRS